MKIAIVGGGIIGTYLAWKLSKDNNVTVFERDTKGKHICSGLVTNRVWKYIPKKQSLVENRFNYINIHFPKKIVRLNVIPPVLALDRIKLNQYIRSFAKKSGAKFVRKELKSLNKLKDFDFIIGAFGAKSIFGSTGTRLAIYTRKKHKKRSNSIDVKPLRRGFSWEFSRKNDVEYGVIEEVHIAKKEFKKLNKTGKIHAAMVPEGVYISKEIALVGDAAGLAKPHSGGGIIWGFEAAEILLRTYPDIKKYNKELIRFFGPKIFFSKLIARLGVFMGNHFPFLVPREIMFDNDWIF